MPTMFALQHAALRFRRLSSLCIPCVQPCMGRAAVWLRLLSLQQPDTCTIYSIGFQCSEKGQGVHSAMTSSAAPPVISGTSIRSSSTSTYATGSNSAAPQVPQVPRFSSVDGEHASKHAEAAEPAAEGTPASQMEQIRLLLQHAVMLQGTGGSPHGHCKSQFHDMARPPCPSALIICHPIWACERKAGSPLTMLLNAERR